MHISVACTDDSHCASGQTCQNNSCTCSQNSECGGTQLCQNGKCFEIFCETLPSGSNAFCTISNNAANYQCNVGYVAVTTAQAGCGM